MAQSTAMRWTNLQARRASVAPFRPAARPRVHRVNRHQCNVAASAAPEQADVVVVGAGIAGLSCAVNLQKQGLKPLVIEASDGVGGRVRTDVVDGFILDRGFQIFLTGYPEAKALLDYEALDLKPFYAGALVWTGSNFERVADPVRHLLDGLLSLTNPVGTVADKINVGLFRLKSLLGTWDELLQRHETTIEERLRAEGFSESIIDQFFRPFLGGIFFDRNLGTSSRLFEFVMRTLALGSNCFPAGGIGTVSEQLAARLPADAVLLNTCVEQVLPASAGLPARVVLASGQEVQARNGVVVAADANAAASMLGEQLAYSPSKPMPGVGTACLYYSAPKPPRDENILYLNGRGTGIVNNCCFPSTVAPAYAPAGRALISVSTLGTFDAMSDKELFGTVKQELAQWFGAAEVASWQPLRIYRIPFAQPNQSPPTDFRRPVELGSGLFVCGDHRDSATLDGAIKSGRRAAEALIARKAPVAPAAAAAQAVAA